MKPREIILSQMDRLSTIETKDPDQACRIAEAICKLAEQIGSPKEPQEIESGNDNLTFKEACAFLGMGETTLNREIASDPTLPIYQPGGPNGRRYFSRTKLYKWKVDKNSERKKLEIVSSDSGYRID